MIRWGLGQLAAVVRNRSVRAPFLHPPVFIFAERILERPRFRSPHNL
jgi:hypothetical protein